MDPADHLAHLRADLDLMLALPAEAADRPIDHCEGWTVRDLYDHTAGVFAFAIGNLDAQPGADLVFDVRLPDGVEGRALFEWAAGELVGRLERIDPTEHRPNWAGAPTSAWYFRRMAQEVAIHRWDAQSAVGEPSPIPAIEAVDGIDELFDVFLADAADRGAVGEGETVHLHATDADDVDGGEWTVTFEPDGVSLERIHGKAQMAARGPASDLLLFTWNRPVHGVELFGDPDLAAWWPTKVSI